MNGSLHKKAVKALYLLSKPSFTRAALRHGVAAGVEHLDVIRLTKAATLIDVGANKGQFSLAFRALMPESQIIAFEPLRDASKRYRELFRLDPRVRLKRVALANREGEAEFYIATRSDSSSLLKPGERQRDAFEVSAASSIRVPVRRLENCVDFARLTRPVLAKIDVQGAELDVLQGCSDLQVFDHIYVELSFVELYDGQPLFHTAACYLRDRGFVLAGVFNQVTTVLGPTQADFLFSRADQT